jgi:hypothetical protein
MAKKENMFTGGTPYFDERLGVLLPKVKPPILRKDGPQAGPPVKEKLTRVSPGMYRDSTGSLVGSRGQKLPGRGQRPSSILDALNGAAPMPGQSLSPESPDIQRILDTWAKSRPVTPEQRPGLGIDPRDPNQYTRMPDGSLFGTYMGWFRDQADAQRGLTPQPKIPTAGFLQDLLKRRG